MGLPTPQGGFRHEYETGTKKRQKGTDGFPISDLQSISQVAVW
jgi:hypothetical protein